MSTIVSVITKISDQLLHCGICGVAQRKVANMNAIIFVFFLTISYSVYGRVTVLEEIVSDISDNLIIDDKEKENKTEPPKVLAKEEKQEDPCHEYFYPELNSVKSEVKNKRNLTSAEQLECLNKLLNFTTDNTVINETALILTPYLEEDRIEEARNACKVDPKVFLGVESYSGFLTVNKTYNSNLFFWYFPVENKTVTETPWIIWLQGGPGASSLTGLFDEIGPFTYKDGQLIRNQFTWLQNHSLVFIDNPVGTGYSFTDHVHGMTQDSTTYGNHLYTAFKQLIKLFPELKSAPLFVAGESYAGKYVPALATEIHTHIAEPDGAVKLEGMMIGNAYVEPAMIAQLAKPFHDFGLLVKEQLDIVQPLVDAFQEDIAANRSIKAKEKFTGLITILLFLSHQKQGYNFLKDELVAGTYYSYLQKSEVKKALHVGNLKFSFINITVNTQLAPDFLSNARPKFEMLLNHYRVLTYCGQLDQMLPCAYVSERYRQWKWDQSQEFLNATRFPYIYNTKLAGYHKTGGGLTEVLFRGAGHMVPIDTPGAAQDLVSRWTHQLPLSSGFGMLEGSYVQNLVRSYSNTSSIYL